MATCLPNFVTSVFYWILILASMVLFAVALFRAAESTGVLGEYCIVLTTALYLFSFAGLIYIVFDNKAFRQFSDPASSYLLITLIVYASFPLCAILIGILMGIVEMLQNKDEKKVE